MSDKIFDQFGIERIRWILTWDSVIPLVRIIHVHSFIYIVYTFIEYIPTLWWSKNDNNGGSADIDIDGGIDKYTIYSALLPNIELNKMHMYKYVYIVDIPTSYLHI